MTHPSHGRGQWESASRGWSTSPGVQAISRVWSASDQCGRVSGLEDAACHAPQTLMEICGSGPVRLRASNAESQSPRAWFVRLRCRKHDRAPWMISRRTWRFPRVLIPRRICLLPVECSAGTRSSHAARSRTFLKLPTVPSRCDEGSRAEGADPREANDTNRRTDHWDFAGARGWREVRGSVPQAWHVGGHVLCLEGEVFREDGVRGQAAQGA